MNFFPQKQSTSEIISRQSAKMKNLKTKFMWIMVVSRTCQIQFSQILKPSDKVQSFLNYSNLRLTKVLLSFVHDTEISSNRPLLKLITFSLPIQEIPEDGNRKLFCS